MSAKKRNEDEAGPAAAQGEQSFEKSLGRLERIVAEMESGDLSLEKMMARFEEGQALVKSCTGKLNEIERKVEMLVRKGEEVTAEPFDENLAEPPESEDAVGDEPEGSEDEEEDLF